MSIDTETARVLLGLFSVLNTALLVYQAVRLQSVHNTVNGARDAAVEAARAAGFMAGSQPPPDVTLKPRD